MDIKEKIKAALIQESDIAFGITSFAPVTEIEEEKKEESSESSSSSSETSESKECKKHGELTEAEEQDIRLSARQIRTLMVASIAESMVNESVDDDSELVSLGLLTEAIKLTPKGKEWITKFFPTLFAS